MDLSNSLREKGLNILAEAIEVKGEKWGNDWIKNNSDLKSADIDSASNEDLDKLKKAEIIKTRELLDVVKDNGSSREESRIRKAVRGSLAFLTVGFTLFLFYKVIFPGGGDPIAAANTSDELCKIVVDKLLNDNKEVIMYILGALSAIVAQIFSFYFGSSESNSK